MSVDDKTLRRLKPAVEAMPWLRRLARKVKASQAPPPRYTDAELISRAEEFNQNAETHWQSIAVDIAGREHVLNKPISTVKDTPAILYRLGLVLAALEPGVGQTILDFGAGSCWLSSYLNRLRCRTISMDVSAAALALGQYRFEHDKRHHLEFGPRFIPYDGHTLPIPDACVDRIVCFDAFHHIPNQEEILAEMFRVLKPGGRAVFAEPGEGHSHEDQSVFEATYAGVLENDLELKDVFAKARRAGFEKMLLKPYPEPSAITLDVDEYTRLVDGETRLFPMATLQENLRHFYVFVLTKGAGVYDSRSPNRLAAAIRLASPAPASVEAGGTLTLDVDVKNEGDTVWLAEMDPCGGYVGLGGHLMHKGRYVQKGYLRTPLPHDVKPGETVRLRAECVAPFAGGDYSLRLDMVDEYVAWFEQTGSPAVEVGFAVSGSADSRKPHVLKAAIAPEGGWPREAAGPGVPLRFAFRLKNTGDTIWLQRPAGEAGGVWLGAHLLTPQADHVASWEYARLPLPQDVAPGEDVVVTGEIPAPPEAGEHLLRFDLVAEGVAWFESFGRSWVDAAVTVGNAVPDSRRPGLLRAELKPANGGLASEAACGSTLKTSFRVTNTGNTRWLPGPLADGGHVALGAHLKTAEGVVVDLDYVRAQLAGAVEPGQTVEVPVALRVPAKPGDYRLEFDMVAEGRCWFASKGSAPVVVELTAVE